jgi:nitrate reductase assembly molybdenum cofactor insertion protein NarJ
MENRNHYHLLAGLFEYPDAGFPEAVRQIKLFLDGAYPEAAGEVGKFLEYLPDGDVVAMQELFTRSFDVQAIATLDIGYTLFGDDYKRGELLANLNREHLAVKNDCGTELADHLPNLLRLMSLLTDEELIDDLAYAIIGPALLEMIGEFDPGRLDAKNKSYEKHYKTLIDTPAVKVEAVTLYKLALNALYLVLKEDFSRIEVMPLKRESDFLKSVGRENEIEESAVAQY